MMGNDTAEVVSHRAATLLPAAGTNERRYTICSNLLQGQVFERGAQTTLSDGLQQRRDTMFAQVDLQPGNVISWIIVGLIAGWLTGLFFRGAGYGILMDV